MSCYHPFQRQDPRTNMTYQCPCGWCIGCRIDRRKQWQMRVDLTRQSFYVKHPDYSTYFVTLTYRDQFLPKHGVSVHDARNFIKRLRERIYRKSIWDYLVSHGLESTMDCSTVEKQKLVPRPDLKFYLASEYGEKRGRPHYHAVIMLPKQYASEIRNSWPQGRVEYDFCRKGGVRYVLKYMDKQYSRNSDLNLDLYAKNGLEPPFCLKSQGLMRDYIEQNLDRIKNDGYVMYNGSPRAVPRYYADKFGIDSSLAVDAYRSRLADMRKYHLRSFNNWPALRQQEESVIRKERSHHTPVFDYRNDKRSAYATLIHKNKAEHGQLVKSLVGELL